MTEQLAEQPVVAEPPPPGVDRAEEDAGTLRAVEEGCGVGATGDRPARLGREPVAVAPREGCRRERDACGPALGAPGEAVHLVRGEIDPGNAGEHPGDLVRVEGEVVGPQLLQLTGRAQPAERKGRVPAGGDDDVDVLGQAFHEEGDGLVHGRVGDHVIVVQDEHDRPGLRDQVVDQQGNRGVADRAPPGGQGTQRAFPDAGRRLPERGQHVAPEQDRVVVAGVERHPGDQGVTGCAPLGEQRGLSPNRRGRRAG